MERRKGGSSPVEVSGLDARFECPICLLCLKDPILTSCGHRFCSTCIEKWLTRNNPCCPVDNKPLGEKDLFPDNYTRREILTQTVPCTICNREFSLSDLDQHVANEHEASKCYFDDFGCNIDFPAGKLSEHLEKEIHYHMRLLQLQMKPVASSSKTEEAQLWEAGKESEKTNSLIRVLYERVVLLEQRTYEHQSQIQRYKRENMDMQQKLDELSLRHCFGEFLWKIKDFRKKIEELRANQGCHFSPGFFSSPAGYKFCARVNIATSNPDYLSIVIHLMQSENDIALPWPFAGTISMAVLHPTKQDWSILDTIAADPKLEAFARPAREINPKAYGFMEYAPISTLLEDDQFLVNGTLYIKILIQTRTSS